ncbi:MAG: hypothetical protein CM15mV41_0240 [Caudoviricetes sp.]|nr:MAG: hypothetical protein CM15mV41_0240 [Caudoviricetes sp.]
MSFLKEVAKEIGNEYAGLVSEGVAAGDTADYIDTGVTFSMLWLAVQSRRCPLKQDHGHRW